ncbi:MAG TPA: hypothetical protein VN132_05115 [Bdellovibrio sp.]|nr:hypothetical protein [Bdellovibrio sp.]
MKTVLFLVTMFTLNFAQAKFTTDIPGKAITCQGDQFVVKLSKDRSKVLIIEAKDPKHPEYFTVKSKDTDGDTFVSYEAIQDSEDPETVLTLFLDDQGDRLQYRYEADVEAPLPLKCK